MEKINLGKILIFGSNGMAGHLLEMYLKENKEHDIYTVSRSSSSDSLKHFSLDCFDLANVNRVLQLVKPSYVVNCVGMLVKDSEDHPDKAIFVNAYFPQMLNQLALLYNYKFIHISTDCVFSGRKGEYTEIDTPDEVNVYGRTKALGEIKHSSNTLTIRTSIIGPEIKKNGIGLFHWFNLQSEIIKGYSNAIWSGVTTVELAKFIVFLIKYDIKLSGLLHLVNNASINKKNLMELFKRYYNKHLPISDDPSVILDKSIISIYKLPLGYQVPSYETMVEEMAKWIESHKEIYVY